MGLEKLSNIPSKAGEVGKYPVMLSIFHDFKEFAAKVDAALIASKQGGFKVGSPGFIRYVVGNTDLSQSEYYSMAKKEIMMMASILEISRRKKQDESRRADNAGDPRIIESMKMEEKEGERTGLGDYDDVEEYHWN